jgi:transposase
LNEKDNIMQRHYKHQTGFIFNDDVLFVYISRSMYNIKLTFALKSLKKSLFVQMGGFVYITTALAQILRSYNAQRIVEDTYKFLSSDGKQFKLFQGNRKW